MPPIEPSNFPRTELADKLASATVQILFAYRNSATDWDLQRLPMQDDLQEEFRKRAETCAVSLRDELAGRPYDPQWDLQQDEYFFLANNPPVGGNFFAKLAQFAEMPEFREKRRIRFPNAWVTVAQLDDDSLAYFGARITAKSVLARDSRLVRVIYSDGRFDALDDTVITFGASFDWICWKGVLIVLHKGHFHEMFRDVPALVARVDANIASVTEHIGIDNLDEFRTRIKSYPAMMVKLQGVIDRADMHTRSPDVLRKYATEYNIAVDWNEDRLVFDGSIQKQWNILRLLDEAHTLGPVTGKHWESASKVQV